MNEPIEIMFRAMLMHDDYDTFCQYDAGLISKPAAYSQMLQCALQGLEDAGFRIVTEPPERPDWSEDKYGIELWFQEYKEWLEKNASPHAAKG